MAILPQLVQLALEDSQEDIKRFVPYQHILWTQNAKKESEHITCLMLQQFEYVPSPS